MTPEKIRGALWEARHFERRALQADHPHHVLDYIRASEEAWVWALVALLEARKA